MWPKHSLVSENLRLDPFKAGPCEARVQRLQIGSRVRYLEWSFMHARYAFGGRWPWVALGDDVCQIC